MANPADPSWLEYLTAIGSVATPVFVVALTALAWRYRQSLERKFALEEKMREDRIQIYNKILEPFIILLMTDAAWKSNSKNKNRDKNEMATNLMLSLEYRQLSFRLSLIGSDNVVLAFNELMQYFYGLADNGTTTPSAPDLREMLSLLGEFLLQIRRSMGNETTQLDNWGMLEWFITDARKYRDGDVV